MKFQNVYPQLELKNGLFKDENVSIFSEDGRFKIARNIVDLNETRCFSSPHFRY